MSKLDFLRQIGHEGSKIFSTLTSHTDLAADLRKAQQLLKDGAKDDFQVVAKKIASETGLVVQEGSNLANLSWFGRTKFYIRHTWNQFVGSLKTLYQNGKATVEKTFDDIIAYAKGVAPAAKAEAKVAATEIKAAAAHMDELKGILADDVAVAQLVRNRYKNIRLTTKDPVANHVLDTLMKEIDLLDPRKLGLNHKELNDLKLAIQERAIHNQTLMLRDANGHPVRTAFVDSNKELHKIATIQILEEQGHLAKLIDGNKTVKAAVEKAMGFKPDFIARTHHEFSELTEAGQQHILVEFNKAKDEIINGKKVLLKDGKTVKKHRGVAVREPGLKAEQLEVVNQAAKDEGLALTTKQADALALKRAEYQAQVNHGLIPENHGFDDEIYNLMREHHANNTTVVTRKLTNSYGRQNTIKTSDHKKISDELKAYGFDVTPDSLKEVITKEQFAKFIEDLRAAA